jgi:hypothetical protein
MNREEISPEEILGYNANDSLMKLEPQQIFWVVNQAIERTMQNIPDGTIINQKNRKIISETMRTELVYQLMLHTNNIGPTQ